MGRASTSDDAANALNGLHKHIAEESEFLQAMESDAQANIGRLTLVRKVCGQRCFRF